MWASPAPATKTIETSVLFAEVYLLLGQQFKHKDKKNNEKVKYQGLWIN